MILKVIKKDDYLEILQEEVSIEKYKMTETIDFSLLMKKLILLELKEKIEYECEDSNFNEQDKTLYSLLCEIKDNYNKNVDEFINFKTENEVK